MTDVSTASVNGADAPGGGATTTIYEIKDTAGEVVAEHVRIDKPDGTKDIKWRQPNGTWGLNGTKLEDLPLYGVHELDDEPLLVVVVEGEKTRNALAKALEDTGVCVVGTVTGSGVTPSVKTLEDLRGHEVVLWPDTDKSGINHMACIAERLRGIAALVRVYTWHDAPEVWVVDKNGERKRKAQDAADHPAVKNG